MNKNVAIVTIILVLVVIAGYLVWLRNRYQPPVSPQLEQEVQATPSVEPKVSASPSATPIGKEATGSTKQKTSTPGSSVR
ncbi:MAG: hypothetical protein Q8Q91_03235 [Candidatus Daviesbacteria bacterium]|nr:hypothetical protein [Candidatus Daviesbacteria bacterium]